MNIGESIDKLFELREQRREIAKQDAVLKAEFEAIELDLIGQLQAQGMETGKSKIASATISESLVPVVDDWGAFYEYIISSNQPYLLERRPSVTAFRDLKQAGEDVPGVSGFNKISLSLRTLR